MCPHDESPDRLNDAVEALLAGVGEAADPGAADLPADLRPLVEAGARLAAARAAVTGGPRPGFVLALEEQLRADLRLGPAGGSAGRGRLARWIVTGLIVLSGLGAWVASERSGPADLWYPVKRAVESLRMALAWTAADKATTSLDLGWRRLDEAGRLIDGGGGAPLDDVIEDMTSAYTVALAYAEQSDDRRVVFQAQSETRLAVDQLARLMAQADPATAALLRDVHLVLSDVGEGRRIVAVTGPSGAAAATSVVGVPVDPAPTEPAAAPTLGPPAVATAMAPPGPSATVPPTARPPAPSPSPLPPSPPPTGVPATAAPPTNVPPTEPPVRPRDPDPTSTPTGVPATPDSGAARTPNPWPSTPTEPPRTPNPWSTPTSAPQLPAPADPSREPSPPPDPGGGPPPNPPGEPPGSGRPGR